MKPFIIFQPSGIRGEVSPGVTLREAALKLGVAIEQVCGGNKSCGKCKVQIKEGYFPKYKLESKASNLSPPGESEKEKLGEELEKGYRLACAAQVFGDIVVFLPEESRGEEQVVRKEAGNLEIELKPAVEIFNLEIPKPSLEDPLGDYERVQRELKKILPEAEFSIDYHVLKKLPEELRNGNFRISLALWNNKEIISISSLQREKIYGIAFDVGTTTCAGYLLDLTSGEVVASDSTMNPQVAYGEDVMARVTYAMEHSSGLEELQKAIIEGLNRIVSNLCSKAGVKAEDILEVTVAGNTAMHHLLLGINPEPLGLSPFTPALHGSLDIKARELGLKIAHSANVHVLPIEAGFVGADNVAVALALEPHKSDKIKLIMDIGTNGEIILGNSEKLLSASCATGPALEGAQIKFGMRASKGAIERVRIDPESLEPRYKVIGSEKWSHEVTKTGAKGICGSGIIEAVAEMFKAGIIKNTGAFNSEINSPRIRKGKDGAPEYVLAWAQETATGRDIVVTQGDVRALQLAKAALYAGCKILMKRYPTESIDEVILAGAFGSYIDKEAAMLIGMFPSIELEKVKVAGNAAGDGARIALLNRDKRKEAEEIARRIKYIELTVDPIFQEEFVKAMYFPHIEDSFPHIEHIIKR